MKDKIILNLFEQKKDVFDKYFIERKFLPEEVIFEENTKGESLFIIKSGKVIIQKTMDKEKKEYKDLAILFEGDFFGEMAILEEGLRFALAKALTDCTLIEIKKNDFFSFTEKFPDLGLKIFSEITKTSIERLQHTSKELTLLFDISKLLTKTYTDEKYFLNNIVQEISFYFEGDWNIEAKFYNYFNEEFELAGKNNEFEGETLSQIDKTEWVNENLYNMLIKDEDKKVAYLTFNSKEKLNIQEMNNWSTIFNTISFIVSSGLKNIKAYKELIMLNKLKDRKNYI